MHAPSRFLFLLPWVGTLVIGFQGANVLSKFYATFLNNCGRVASLGTATCFESEDSCRQGQASC